MNLLALDQASRVSGYAIFIEGKLTKYGKFSFDDEDFGIRLMKIRNKVQEIIKEYSINQVIFEDIQLQNSIGNNVDTFKKLAEVRGVVHELLTEIQIPYLSVLSTVWKSKLKLLHGQGQKRESQKKAAQDWVIKNYNIKPTQDEADAICLGVYGLLTLISNEEGYDWSE